MTAPASVTALAATPAASAVRVTRHSVLLTRGAPPPHVARFLAFVRSPDGARVITANGAVPVP